MAKVKTKGNYLYEIARDHAKLENFILSFIDFHLMKLLDNLISIKESEITA